MQAVKDELRPVFEFSAEGGKLIRAGLIEHEGHELIDISVWIRSADGSEWERTVETLTLESDLIDELEEAVTALSVAVQSEAHKKTAE